jgi:hypothetical protein
MEKKLCLDPERKREPKDLLKLLSNSAVASRVCFRRCDRSCTDEHSQGCCIHVDTAQGGGQ